VGGLSGAPVHEPSVRVIRMLRECLGPAFPIVGVGGIASADDAWQRVRAGASLVQLYTAMVYEGPGVARRIAHGLAQRLKREGFANIAEAVGTE
jgi:dihydroorotate dehydrogenase